MTPLRVMVVEDEPTIAMLLARVLRNQGHEVCAVATSEAGAIAAAALHHPQIILVDVRLRPGSGVAAMRPFCTLGLCHMSSPAAP